MKHGSTRRVGKVAKRASKDKDLIGYERLYEVGPGRNLQATGGPLFTFMERKRFHQIAVDEAPQLFLALVIAETAYKFHSFTAEAAAFLGTWWLLSALRHYRR